MKARSRISLLPFALLGLTLSACSDDSRSNAALPFDNQGSAGDGGGGRAGSDGSVDTADGGSDADDDASSTQDGSADAESDGATDGSTGTGTGASETATIGPNGGTLSLTVNGCTSTVTVPAGALESDTELTLTDATDAPPAGYTVYSPVYRLEPTGLQFAKPVSVSLCFEGDEKLATLFWSYPGANAGYERVGGAGSAGHLEAKITHFSSGFVANGVEYTETADPTCVSPNLLGVRRYGASSVALQFTVDDCYGRPVTGLTCDDFPSQCDFVLKEDGVWLAEDTVATVLEAKDRTIFVSLVVDMSNASKGALEQVIAGAKGFVRKLQGGGNPQRMQIALEAFGGEADLTELQAPTLDQDALLAKLDSLATWKPTDPSSTNLNGAVKSALERLAQQREAYEERNDGGAFTSGYVVLVTSGHDSAGLIQANDLGDTNSARIVAVGVDSPVYDAAALEKIATGGLFTSPDSSTLDRDFQALANRIAGEVNRTYVLSYCSPKRAGTHTVALEIAGRVNVRTATYPFSADNFVAGCSAETFQTACTRSDGVARECGGLGCGGCDDRAAGCDVRTDQCLSYCAQQYQCGGAGITNPVGYGQTCNDTAESTKCGAGCVNLISDRANCGGCGTSCSGGDICSSSACMAPPPPSSCAASGAGRTDCGASGDESCCTSLPVPGGTVKLDDTHSATVSDYRLDKYEITIGRFRAFVDAWLGGWRPSMGAGKHAHLNGGNGLSVSTGGYEPGWDSAWNKNLAASKGDWDTNLSCGAPGQGWTNDAGGNEKRPISCATWYETAAFCIWDGGFLPSEAEWQYAAAGGSENRQYPWGAAAPSDGLAVFCGGSCDAAQNIGSKPSGNGKWGQSDLAGNVAEWTMDAYGSPYPLPASTDYYVDVIPASYRTLRGGWFGFEELLLAARNRYYDIPMARYDSTGGRCARLP